MISSELFTVAQHSIKNQMPLLVLGAPGLGKTAIMEQAAESVDFDVQVLYLSMIDPVEMYGLTVPITEEGKRRVERLLDDMLLSIVESKKPMLLLLDELDKASATTQSAVGPLLLARRIGKHQLPDHVAIGATANRRSDRAGSQGILSHIISRMTTVFLDVDVQAWTKWATQKGLHPSTISFIRHRPSLLHDFDAEKVVAGSAPYPCPRTWEEVSQHTIKKVPDNVASIVYAGCVGQAAALEYASHLRLYNELPDLEAAMDAPDNLVFPTTIGGLYALVSGLAVLASNNKNAAAIFRIAERLISAKKSEYAACLVVQFVADIITMKERLSY